MDKEWILNWYKEIGVDEIISSTPVNKLTNPVQNRLPSPPSSLSSPSVNITENASVGSDLSSIQTLEELRKQIEAFEGCDLKKTAMNTVFSDGQPDAKIMVIGEAPGADEDRLGKPFVGLSGQLLDLMFQSIGLSRTKNIYITNTIPWRPPGNRNPTTQELNTCLSFLHQHIRLVNPSLLLLVGGISTKTILGTDDSLSKLRGRIHEVQIPFLDHPIKAYPLYHPAYLLRSPGQKRLAWKDLLFLKQWLKENHLL